ncbi:MULTISPECIES: pyridoxal-phosphate dependent enzyme [unclassified Streptomyces]|uniref:pyridoxal-phosphate dependent enzyme n=1 Tax=unclassified Streptomyces TaxID=2593676 RepID=UPI000881487E|nr:MULTISPECIES: pyridoxal-phosphate dependent enzyme [unclassified Streptomyces]PBC86592.1 threonine synthase [Streptomyces sp. 2321.6]SDQ79056.1 threonine synthase [Streptomyces sp. KS_16]SEE03311.1 threonine synthase [Streptomyces sp. 2133.1]SNC73670.1 threonine synthase [Streptomyces sp. 2114.4]
MTSRPPLHCLRCARAAEGFAGCRTCAAEGIGVNTMPPLADLAGVDLAGYPGGPWGLPTALPVSGPPVTLGEGNTPCIRLRSGSEPPQDGAPAGELWLKYEGGNPTGSHKDRAMAVGVAAAVAAGAGTVVAASSGNAGAAAAAYAARAGLRCVVFTNEKVPAGLRTQIDALGAERRVHPGSTAARNAAMAKAVEEHHWYPLTSYSSPSPGGNPYANEGYKSVAYELARDFAGRRIDVVVVPTSRADLLAGVGRGFRELAAAGLIAHEPRLVAAEPSAAAPFTAALRCPDRADQERTRVAARPTVAFSLGEERPCWQGLDALWRTAGTAVALDDEAIGAEHRRLAAQGLILEPSSAVGSAVAREPARTPGTLVVALGTATGLKGLVG